MKLVVPMAGRGVRFADAGYATPKPLIDVEGRPMVEWAFRSLDRIPRSETVFVALREHEERYGLRDLLTRLAGPQTAVVLLDDVTDGQLCTVLAARDLLTTDEDVLVASADTCVAGPLADDIATRAPETRGIISVIDLPGDHWSFARTDADGRVVEVAEKRRISDHCSTGLYHFASGRELVEFGEALVREGVRTRGEFYVIPVYQSMIDRGLDVRVSHATGTWDMGNPVALARFKRAVQEGSLAR